MGALGVCTILYIGVSFVLTGMVHYTKLNVSDPVAFALQVVGLNSVAGIISAGAIIGITTVLIALVYAQVRLTFAMSRDGLMPKVFSKVHPKSQTPVANTWLTGAVAACIVGFVNLSTLANLVSIGTLAAFTVISIAVIILRKNTRMLKQRLKCHSCLCFQLSARSFVSHLRQHFLGSHGEPSSSGSPSVLLSISPMQDEKAISMKHIRKETRGFPVSFLLKSRCF